MNKKHQIRIAILGATGHIAKNLILYFSGEKKCELFLFSRNKDKVNKIIQRVNNKGTFSINTYDNFNKSNYDVIINCIGISDPNEIKKNGISILTVTEHYDNKILNYLEKSPSTLYINFSSGAVYGNAFINPINHSTSSKLSINNLKHGDFYSVSKIHSEAKHRALTNLNIVDLRIFGFFSRFIDPHDGYFMSEVIASIKNNKELQSNNINFIRDFVDPRDLYLLIKKIIQKRAINEAFDVYSKSPVSKFEILKTLSQRYGLKYAIKEKLSRISPTGIKMNYYSNSRKAAKIGYVPKYSSIDTIINEIKYIIQKANTNNK
jgi:nucleoside-diphosphate-sugar epimerase